MPADYCNTPAKRPEDQSHSQLGSDRHDRPLVPPVSDKGSGTPSGPSSAAKSGTPDRGEFAPESVPIEPKEREERQDRATRCFSAFLASLSTLLGYEINPWLGWGWLVCLGVIYAYTEVVS